MRAYRPGVRRGTARRSGGQTAAPATAWRSASRRSGVARRTRRATRPGPRARRSRPVPVRAAERTARAGGPVCCRMPSRRHGEHAQRRRPTVSTRSVPPMPARRSPAPPAAGRSAGRAPPRRAAAGRERRDGVVGRERPARAGCRRPPRRRCTRPAASQAAAWASPSEPSPGRSVRVHGPSGPGDRHTAGRWVTLPSPSRVTEPTTSTPSRSAWRRVPTPGRSRCSPAACPPTRPAPIARLSGARGRCRARRRRSPTTRRRPGSLGVCTSDTRAPAPQPPKVAKGCGSSRTAAASPRQVLHRVLEWAPAGAHPDEVDGGSPRGGHEPLRLEGRRRHRGDARPRGSRPPAVEHGQPRARGRPLGGARARRAGPSPHGVTTTRLVARRQGHVGRGHPVEPPAPGRARPRARPGPVARRHAAAAPRPAAPPSHRRRAFALIRLTRRSSGRRSTVSPRSTCSRRRTSARSGTM